MTGLILMTVLAQIWMTVADFPCVCNYGPEKAVYAGMDNQGLILGYLHEYDCKQTLSVSAPVNGWVPIAFRHEVAFMVKVGQLETQICLGEPLPEDRFTPPPSETSTTAITMTRATTTRTSPTTTSPRSSSTITTTVRTTLPPAIVSGHLELCPTALVNIANNGQGVLAQYGGSCYMGIANLASWSHAETNCRTLHGHLVSITSSEEQNFLYNMLVNSFNHNVWIGLHDRTTEETFEWVSGEVLTYTNWAPNRLTTNHNTEDCVLLIPGSQGLWDDIPCGGNNVLAEAFGVRHSYICEVAVDPTLSTYAPVVSGSHTSDGNNALCPAAVRQRAQQHGGILAQYKEHCYEILPRYKFSWGHAQQVCRNLGGNLAHISDADEQDFIQQFMTRHNPNNPVWIGLNDINHEGTFTWISGDAANYMNWVPNHVRNPTQENCVAFYPNMRGMWDDISCGGTNIFGGDFGETHTPLCQYRTTVAGTIVG